MNGEQITHQNKHFYFWIFLNWLKTGKVGFVQLSALNVFSSDIYEMSENIECL